jgi:hypothetical protein
MADKKTNRFIGLYIGAIIVIVVISRFISNNDEPVTNLEKPISAESVDAAIEKQKALPGEGKTSRSNTKKVKTKALVPERRTVTIDGTDPDVGVVIQEINLWKNYQTRTWAGRVKHGQKVYFIKREGDGVLVETKSGLKGWVTYWFIKEETR